MDTDGSLLLFTPIDPIFLIIPLLVSLLTTRSKSSPTTKPDAFSTTLSLESSDAKREDRFLPLDDLIGEASLQEVYRLAEPFAEVGKGEGKQEKEGEWMGCEDVVRLCRLESVRSRLKDACETQCELLSLFLRLEPIFNTSPAFNASDESEATTFYRPSPARILTILRAKTTALAHPPTFAAFPSLVAQILRNGLDEEVLAAYRGALDEEGGKEREVERKKRIAEQARVRVACEIIGGYLSPDVFQALVSSYEYVPPFPFSMHALTGYPIASRSWRNTSIRKRPSRLLRAIPFRARPTAPLRMRRRNRA